MPTDLGFNCWTYGIHIRGKVAICELECRELVSIGDLGYGWENLLHEEMRTISTKTKVQLCSKQIGFIRLDLLYQNLLALKTQLAQCRTKSQHRHRRFQASKKGRPNPDGSDPFDYNVWLNVNLVWYTNFNVLKYWVFRKWYLKA